jgi:hypothetical protein
LTPFLTPPLTSLLVRPFALFSVSQSSAFSVFLSQFPFGRITLFHNLPSIPVTPNPFPKSLISDPLLPRNLVHIFNTTILFTLFPSLYPPLCPCLHPCLHIRILPRTQPLFRPPLCSPLTSSPFYSFFLKPSSPPSSPP